MLRPKINGVRVNTLYIHIIYAPNLRLRIAAFDREREHGRFEGSNKRVVREQERAYRDMYMLVPFLCGAQQIRA